MPASNSVLLDRKYFKELLRRANCSAANNNGAERAFEHATLIPSDEYEALQHITRRFVNLCENLRAGGVEEDALETLCGGDEEEAHVDPPLQAPPAPTYNNARNNNVYENNNKKNGGSPPLGVDTSSNSRPLPRAATGSYSDLASEDGRGDAPSSVYDFEDSNTVDPSDGSQSGSGSGSGSGTGTGTGAGTGAALSTGPERQSLRTIQLVNLPETATLADVAAAVRGGPLLELYIRVHDRSAFVSFVRGPDAKEFFDHVRKHDLYIKARRIDIRWSERQFSLLPHVASQINAGATRNMIIYQCDPRITDELIRKDLKHIHNLVLYTISFAHGNCYIKANSVHNAMFARSCLMSRAAYKGSRIEWDADECAEALPRIAPVQRNKKKKKPTAKKPPTFAAPNRFQLLKLTDEENAPSESVGDDTNGDDEDVAFAMP